MPRKPREITVDWIMSMAVEDAGCLIWQGQTCNDGKDPRSRSGTKHVNIRRALWNLNHDTPVRSDRIIVMTCGVDCCIEPIHMEARTRKQLGKGKPKTLLHRARIAATKRAASPFSDAMVEEVRASELSLAAEGARHGMSTHLVRMIRTNQLRRDYSSPFLGLGAQP